jgi:hypothetical protein
LCEWRGLAEREGPETTPSDQPVSSAMAGR